MTVPLIRSEVHLDAIAHNIREFRRIVSDDVKIMPAVKADGYGHGAVRVSVAALESGADALGVARIEEGMVLRNAGIAAPILVFGYTSPDNTDTLIDYDLTATVSMTETAREISGKALARGKKVNVHLKIDTGMGRIGMLTSLGHPGCVVQDINSTEDVMKVATLPGIELEGIYTHFASADAADKTDAKYQHQIFVEFLEDIKKNGLEIPLKHSANSAAAIQLPETHLDMIRPGISFYGLFPSGEVDRTLIDLKPAMELKAKIISLKRVPAGFRVSYGSTYVTKKETVIAVVPIGYADGFSRHFSSNGEMLVHGKRAPILGRVCMDLTMIDVGHIPDVAIEDDVVIFGQQGSEMLHVDELASRIDTINYEIVSALTSRVPRVYPGHL